MKWRDRPIGPRPLFGKRGARGLLALLLLVAADPLVAYSQLSTLEEYGALELDTRSSYSHVRLRRKDSCRSLVFVRDSGQEAVESTVDLNRPYELVFDYTKYMFLSYLFQPKPEKVLLIGLGGGSMVHFLRHYDPQVTIDVIDIDPGIIQIADRYFGVHNGEKVRIRAADGLKYIAGTRSRYDVIYLDAFLKPARDTDHNGVPLRLKTQLFYKQLQARLNPGGVIAFNLNPSAGLRDDVRGIARAFSQTYVYPMPRSQGVVVVASLSTDREPLPALIRKAEVLDSRFKTTFSFKEMAARLAQNGTK